MKVRADLWEGALQFYGVIHDNITVTANVDQVKFWFDDIHVKTHFMPVFIEMTKDLHNECWLVLANKYRDYLYLSD